MDEAKLQEILDDAAERLALGRYSNADASVHALVAEVRRLTAALATVREELCVSDALAAGHIDRLRDELARLRAEHAAALATARCEARAEALRECFDIADGCATQRRATLARWTAEGVPSGDERRVWVYCKASEAERIRDAIRALPLDAPGGAT